MLLALGTVHAGPGAATLAQQALSVNPDASLVVVCSSLRPVVEAIRGLPLPASLLDDAGPEARAALAALSPDGAARNGLDLDGPMVLLGELDGNGSVLQVPFNGTREQAEQLLELLWKKPVAVGDRWRLPDGTTEATLEPGRLVLTEAASGVAPEIRGKVAGMLSGLPDAEGCLAVGYTSDLEDGPATLGVYYPFQGAAPLTLRLDAPAVPPPEVLATGGWLPPLPTLPRTPDIVGGLSVPIDRVLDFMEEALDGGPGELEDFRRHVRFPGGVYLAGYVQGSTKAFLAVLPVARPSGAPFPARKVMRMVRAFGEEGVRVTGRTTFEFATDKQSAYGEARPGFVLVSSDLALLQEVGDDLGPWLTEEQQAWSRRWPVFVRSVGVQAFEVSAGLRADGPVWELAAEVKLPAGTPREATAAIAGMATALALPALTQARLKSQREDAVELVERLRGAELARATEGAGPLALPATPRPVEALTREAVPFLRDGAWAELGGLDLPPQTRCSYRVDLVEGGFEAWGVCDLDGDGAPATIRARHDEPAVLLSGEEAF